MSDCINHNDYNADGRHGAYGKRMYKGKVERSHRVAYCESNNIELDDIKGLEVRHTCDNPKCINPEHLLIGTHQDNQDDKVLRNRQVQGEAVHTSVLTLEDVRYIRSVYVPRHREFGACALGRRFGVSNTTVDRLVKGFTWKGVL